MLSVLKEKKIEALIFGGAIRDALLGKECYETDIIVNADVPKIIKTLELAGLKPTSALEGKISIRSGETSIDILSFEHTSVGKMLGKHAFLSERSIEAMALASDLSINSLVLHPSGILYDFCGGVRDIQNRNIRFLTPFSECGDLLPINILRYLRFGSEFGCEAQDLAEKVFPYVHCFNHVPEFLKQLAAQEFKKIMVGNHTLPALLVMHNTGILNYFIGKTPNSLEHFTHFLALERSRIGTNKNMQFLIRYAALTANFGAKSYEENYKKTWQHSGINKRGLEFIRTYLALSRYLKHDNWRIYANFIQCKLGYDAYYLIAMLSSIGEVSLEQCNDRMSKLLQFNTNLLYHNDNISPQIFHTLPFADHIILRKSHGFSLVELSIVLVIISLILSSVLVGQELIRAQKIRSVISRLEQYDSATNTFRVKYDCLPGDCSTDPDVLGISDGEYALNFNSANTYYEPNGDGIIGGTVISGFFQFCEAMDFFVFLHRADLISDELYELIDPADFTAPSIPVLYSPATEIHGGYVYLVNSTDLSAYSMPNFQHAYWISVGHTPGKDGAAFPADTASAIDRKKDDGLPESGIIQATGSSIVDILIPGPPVSGPNSGEACINNSTSPATYHMESGSNPASECGLLIRTDF